MIARALWYALLAVIGLVTAGLQLDREAEAWGELAPFVPEPFRSFAQARIVAESLDTGNASETLREAQRLVARRPAPAENLTLLALAQNNAGDIGAASRSIQIAAARGWRDPLVQDTVARMALDAGDTGEAARRYTALMLQPDTPDALLRELGPEVFGEPGGPGREAMAEVVSGTYRWGSLFLRRGAAVMPPDAFREVTTRSIEEGARFECATFDQAVATLSRRDEGAGAALAASLPPECSIDRGTARGAPTDAR